MDEPADHHATPAAWPYADWKAPPEDGGLIIWPGPPVLLDDALANNRSLRAADAARIQNVPLPEVRRLLRAFLGHNDDAVPLIATGHQTELHHPGVWVKNALIDAVAAKLGGRAYHFAVDTDAPKHLTLRWPGAGDAPGGSESLSDDPAAGTDKWSGLLNPPTPAHLNHLSTSFERVAAGWGFRPLVPSFLASLRRGVMESANLSSALTNALHELDWGLGLRYDALTVSPLCQSEPYLVFVHHVLSRAGEFAVDYNAALADYRRENKIRTPGRPMPDLRIDAGRCEVPFWLDDLPAGTRQRAGVVRSDGGWALRLPDGSPDDEFRLGPTADGWDAAAHLLGWLRRHGLRLSPRALTLTAVLRLLAADQFVHGIGGGRYDQVLDALIARHFGIEPPRFAVTTATLYFPDAVGTPRACVPCVKGEGHRLKHQVLGAEKARRVEAIAAAPFRSAVRSALFHAMHRDMAAASVSHPAVREWEGRLAEMVRREQQERTLFDRELFYAVQPADRLGELIERYRVALG